MQYQQQLDDYSSTGSTLKLNSLIIFFKRLSSLRGMKKSVYVREFIEALFKQNRSPSYTYSILRLILPNQDRERGNYGLKEKALARIISQALSLKKQDYERLYHYKNPNYHQTNIGDFSICVYDVTHPYLKRTPTATISQLNSFLDSLTITPNQTHTFRELLNALTAQQLKWVIRIILKDLKLGIKIQTVLNTFHPDGNQCFNLLNSIKQTCKKLQNRSVSLSDEVEMFHSIRPMLAGKRKLEYFRTQNRAFYLETKYDGERIQAHISPQLMKLYSRNGVDYSQTYEEILPLMRCSVQPQCCILDGEMVVIDRETHSMMPFGLNKVPAFSKADANLQIVYKIFDILYLKEGVQDLNMMGYSLKQRKNILTKVIKQINGRVEIVPHKQVFSYDCILREFNESIQRNQQGIMLKDPNSMYVPKERGSNWLKLKGDYVEGLTQSLDLIILGGYYGGVSYRLGKDSHWTSQITCFLLGVIEKIDQANPKIAYAIPFGRTGDGYSEEQLIKLRAILKPHLMQCDGKTRPSFLRVNWKYSLANKPDCYIDHLSNSVILEMKAAEITSSDQWPTNCTMRFARVHRVRYDKLWSEAMTKDQLDTLMDESLFTKGMKKKNQESSSDENHERRLKTRKQKQKLEKNKVMKEFLTTDTSNEPLHSLIFNQEQFVVMPMTDALTKTEIERMIVLNNGVVSQNPLKTTKYIVAEEIDFRLKMYQEYGEKQFIFIKPRYVENCIQYKQMIPLSPIYLAVLPNKSTKYQQNFDKFGDSYTAPLRQRELDDILNNMHTNYEIDTNLQQYISFYYPFKKSYCIGIDPLAKIKLKCRGHSFVTTLLQEPNFIIFKQALSDEIQKEINEYRRRNYCQVKQLFEMQL